MRKRKKQHSEFEVYFEKLEDSMDVIARKCFDLEKESENKNDTIAEAQDEIRRLNNTIEEKDDEISDLKDKIAELENDITEAYLIDTRPTA